MNGFFMTSSRLLLAWQRAKMLPSAFGKIHQSIRHRHFVSYLLPLSAASVRFSAGSRGWVVDMCSVGTAFGYFFTCAGAYILLKKYGDPTDTNRIHPAVAMGCFISVAILLLLIIPGFSGIYGTTIVYCAGCMDSFGRIVLLYFTKEFHEDYKA